MPRQSTNQPTPKEAAKVIAHAGKVAAKANTKAWYMILLNIYRASVRLDLGLHYNDPRFQTVTRPGARIDVVYVGGPCAKFYANLGMSDKALKAEFAAWLKIARECVRQPRTGRGPDNLSTQVGNALFDRWRNAHIIEYAHLLVWRGKDRSRARYTKTTLLTWISRGDPKQMKTTKVALRHALDCLPMLAGECEIELLRAEDGGKAAQDALDKRINDDVSRNPWSLRYRII